MWLEQCGSEDFRKTIANMIKNEELYYIKHHKNSVDVWNLWYIDIDNFNLEEFKQKLKDYSSDIKEFELAFKIKQTFDKMLYKSIEEVNEINFNEDSRLLELAEFSFMDCFFAKIKSTFEKKLKLASNEILELLYIEFNDHRKRYANIDLSIDEKECLKINIKHIVKYCNIVKKRYAVLDSEKNKTMNNIKNIALITSETSLGRGDFKHIIETENQIKNIEECLVETLDYVNIIAKIKEINDFENKPDLIAFIRGGSSQNSPITQYNHPDFINAIVESEIPILLGIGHADDDNFLICNEFADYTAITPSEAARKCIELIEQSNNLT